MVMWQGGLVCLLNLEGILVVDGLRRLLNFDLWFFLLAAFLIVNGLMGRETSYLTAETGAGYLLGIIGGSLMLLLLLYPVRKHVGFMRSWGPVKYWFRTHMLFGVAGPVLILYHANFGLGSTNSNIALFCMLIVAGSGLFGRLFYTKIHDGLYGRKIELAELRDSLQSLKSDFDQSETIHEQLLAFEKRVLAYRSLLLAFIYMPVVRVLSWSFNRQLLNSINQSGLAAQDNRHLQVEINQYFQRVVRVADFSVYERLFSLWHVLHIPLFIMMLISGIVHIFAVHIY